MSGNAGTVVDLINRCLHEEMARDERIVIFGEDVADVSREEYLEQVKGKGGVFKVTANLQREFGSARVFNSPLGGSQYRRSRRRNGDSQFETRRRNSIFRLYFPRVSPNPQRSRRNALAFGRRYEMSDGDARSGRRIFKRRRGLSLAIRHDAFFAHAGIDDRLSVKRFGRKRLLRTAIRCDDPVLFFEHKHLYRQVYNKSQYPSSEFMIPFGKAKVVREGTDVTIVTYGALVQRSFEAAKRLEKDGVSVEVIDLRTLVPYDWERIAESVKKTNRVIVAHEDPISYGYGAEIAARISDELFEYLGRARPQSRRDRYICRLRSAA